ncbi:Mitochondrial peroxiredoxin PRX1 [Botrytis cinerea]
MSTIFARVVPRTIRASPRASLVQNSFRAQVVAPLPRRFLATNTLPEQPRLRLGSEGMHPTSKPKQPKALLIFISLSAIDGQFCSPTPQTSLQFARPNLVLFAKLKDEFEKRDVNMIGFGMLSFHDNYRSSSADPLPSHKEWIKDINEVSGTTLQFPIIADADRKVAYLYDMLDAQDTTNIDQKGIAFTIRSVFVIDPAKKIRLTMMYPASCGRNTKEVLRVIDSLQTADKKGVTTPIDWQVGDDVIVPPTVKTEDARKRFGKVREVKPYLRFTNVGQ